MAMLSVLANRVSEVQTKNLQTFPFVFFNEVKEASIDYDLAHRSTEKTAPNGPISKFDSRVTYHLTLNEGANANLEKRFFALQESVRVLFWKDITVEVYLNGKKYESKNG
jgi:hypothetical protein